MSSDIELAPRGVLHPRQGQRHYVEALRPPSDDLADVVLQHWQARWDLRGRDPHEVRVLPSPSAQLVVQDGHARVHGVGTRRFQQTMAGAGSIGGVSFRPAGFRPFLGAGFRSMADLTDAVLDATAVFGPVAAELAERVTPLTDLDERAEVFEAFLRDQRHAVDPQVPLLNRLVEQVAVDRSIVRVEQMVELTGWPVRTLQRLFRQYVGVSPKWVIQRYRLHEAAERLHGQGDVDLAALAADLGYADQAHFARDFTAVVGQAPARYAREARA